jgi:trehalose-6-phosphatase
VGEIHYPDSDGPGYIIYVKSVITRDAPIDIRQYRDANPTFPHQTTTDQWFDEDQFEAYRHLGQLTAERLCDQLLLPDQTRDKTPATAVSWVRELLLRLEQVSNGTQPSEQRP